MSARTSTTTSCANSCATCRPIPCTPPVMMATRFCIPNCMLFSGSFGGRVGKIGLQEFVSCNFGQVCEGLSASLLTYVSEDEYNAFLRQLMCDLQANPLYAAGADGDAILYT